MIANQVIYELSQFIARWFAYQQLRGLAVHCTPDEQRDSPCRYLLGQARYWNYVPRTELQTLHAISEALECPFHPDIDAFYGYGFGGEMKASFHGLTISLVQPWNDEDFVHLQENLVAHVLMLRRLKLPVTLFIATVCHNDLRVISLDNATGAVILEQLGKQQRWTLAPSLAEFLRQLSPLAVPTFEPFQSGRQ